MAWWGRERAQHKSGVATVAGPRSGSGGPFRRLKNGNNEGKGRNMGNAARNRGWFTPGNPGGPGRPRRPVEREYLRALNEAVSLDDWKVVVQAALTQAKEGDGKAREWLARYLIGDDPPRLIDLTVDDVHGDGIESELKEALIAFSKKRRYWIMFDAEALREANGAISLYEKRVNAELRKRKEDDDSAG